MKQTKTVENKHHIIVDRNTGNIYTQQSTGYAFQTNFVCIGANSTNSDIEIVDKYNNWYDDVLLYEAQNEYNESR